MNPDDIVVHTISLLTDGTPHQWRSIFNFGLEIKSDQAVPKTLSNYRASI